MRQADTNLNIYCTVIFACKYVIQLLDTFFALVKIANAHQYCHVQPQGSGCTSSCVTPKCKDDRAGSGKGPVSPCPHLGSDE